MSALLTWAVIFGLFWLSWLAVDRLDQCMGRVLDALHRWRGDRWQ